jgi:hypothetical protein
MIRRMDSRFMGERSKCISAIQALPSPSSTGVET